MPSTANGKFEIRRVKLAKSGSYVFTLPKEICDELGFDPETFLIARKIGPAVVLTRVRNVTNAPAESDAAIDRAFESWKQQR